MRDLFAPYGERGRSPTSRARHPRSSVSRAGRTDRLIGTPRSSVPQVGPLSRTGRRSVTNRPETLCTKNFFCLGGPASTDVPSKKVKQKLEQAGLGKKAVITGKLYCST